MQSYARQHWKIWIQTQSVYPGAGHELVSGLSASRCLMADLAVGGWKTEPQSLVIVLIALKVHPYLANAVQGPELNLSISRCIFL